MLAKVLRPEANTARGIHWPAAEPAKTVFPRGPVDGDPSGYEAGSDGIETEVASLQAELKKTRAEADERVQEAFVAGKREGDALARQAVDQKLESELGKLQGLMRELNLAGPRLRKQTEEELVRLAVAIARRILHRELTIDPEALLGLVKAAFDRLDRKEIQQVRTDAQNVENVKKIVAGVAASVKVVADPSLRPGSLVIDVPRGQLDASIETQLVEIERGFVDIVHHS